MDTTHSKHKKTHKRVLGFMIALVFLCAAWIGGWMFIHTKRSVSSTSSTASASSLQERDPLTGVPVEKAVSNTQLFAVMIDGHIDAQPMSGIDKAFLVLEAPVEAAIPRRLAFFHVGQEIKQIGPVRSARPYFIDWANELDALYVHVGGSNEALEKITTGYTFDLNQFWHDDQFWRAWNRPAPHNVYTSTSRLSEYVDGRKAAGRAQTPLYGVWKFADAPNHTEEGQGERVEVTFSSPDYVFVWVYDQEKKQYIRMQQNRSVLTLNDQEIRADNVAVIKTDIAIIDSVGRRHVRTIGSGEAVVYQKGYAVQAVWKKPSATERLRFFHKNGTEVEMLPGITWIEVLD